jgi:hypothetical protein
MATSVHSNKHLSGLHPQKSWMEQIDTNAAGCVSLLCFLTLSIYPSFHAMRFCVHFIDHILFVLYTFCQLFQVKRTNNLT